MHLPQSAREQPQSSQPLPARDHLQHRDGDSDSQLPRRDQFGRSRAKIKRMRRRARIRWEHA
eukprot:784713-Karenia_brevis.AAC.1